METTRRAIKPTEYITSVCSISERGNAYFKRTIKSVSNKQATLIGINLTEDWSVGIVYAGTEALRCSPVTYLNKGTRKK